MMPAKLEPTIAPTMRRKSASKAAPEAAPSAPAPAAAETGGDPLARLAAAEREELERVRAEREARYRALVADLAAGKDVADRDALEALSLVSRRADELAADVDKLRQRKVDLKLAGEYDSHMANFKAARQAVRALREEAERAEREYQEKIKAARHAETRADALVRTARAARHRLFSHLPRDVRDTHAAATNRLHELRRAATENSTPARTALLTAAVEVQAKALAHFDLEVLEDKVPKAPALVELVGPYDHITGPDRARLERIDERVSEINRKLPFTHGVPENQALHAELRDIKRERARLGEKWSGRNAAPPLRERMERAPTLHEDAALAMPKTMREVAETFAARMRGE